MSAAEADCVDLTEIGEKLLLRLYSQLKQIDDDGRVLLTADRSKLPPGTSPKLTLPYHLIKELEVQSSNRSKEAGRLYNELKLNAQHVSAQLRLGGKKEALELILDEIWAAKGRNFSLLSLFKDWRVRFEDVAEVRALLSNEGTESFDVGQLMCKTLLEPSVLEIVLLTLYIDLYGCKTVYEEIEQAQDQLIYSDDEVQIGEEELLGMIDEAIAELGPEFETQHEPVSNKLDELQQIADDFTKTMDGLCQEVVSLTHQAERHIERLHESVMEAPVTVIDESTPPIRELLPSKYQDRADRLLQRGSEDVQVIRSQPVIPIEQIGRNKSRIVPDQLPKLKLGEDCLVASTDGVFRMAQFASEEATTQQVCVRVSGQTSQIIVDRTKVAYAWDPNFILAEGSRVAAVKQMQGGQGMHVAGTVGEKASYHLNGWRYLIFFDDGTPRYVPMAHTRLLYVQGMKGGKLSWLNAWELVPTDRDPNLRTFLRRYLQAYPNWQICTVRKQNLKHDRILVWRGGEWYSAYIWDLDCRLVQLRYPTTPAVQEWLYRGSLRFREVQKKNPAVSGPMSLTPRHHRGSRRFTQRRSNASEAQMLANRPPAEDDDSRQRLQVAKKRTVFRRADYSDDNSSTSSGEDSRASVQQRQGEMKDVKINLPKTKLSPFHIHKCGGSCADAGSQTDLREFNVQSPFAVPLLLSWHRQLVFCQVGSARRNMRRVQYVAPCGRRLRNETDLTQYLRITNSKLTIDQFTFDAQLRANVRSQSLVEPVMEDYSKGAEDTPIEVVNARNQEKPADITYAHRRFPAVSSLDLQTVGGQFCSGCSCTDDCSDPEKCECQQLTKNSIKRLHPSLRPHKTNVEGYENRRLRDHIMSGIYECNAKCKCMTKKCFNRVVQQPLRVPLQLFKTAKKGWGLRTLVDLPSGQFICIYAGAIWTSKQAEDLGTNRDHYFADLNLVVAVNDEKEDIGVEFMDDPLVNDLDDDNTNTNNNRNAERRRDDDSDRSDVDDSDYSSDAEESRAAKADENTVPPPTDAAQTDEVVIEEEVGPSSMPLPMDSEPTKNNGTKFSIQEYFGDADHFGFTVDARTRGNIGRFLNHSCDPNVFVQNVLVDTHDLRLPWVAFFASRRIRAGEELCWDYQYELQPGRKIACECGSAKCRGRLM